MKTKTSYFILLFVLLYPFGLSGQALSQRKVAVVPIFNGTSNEWLDQAGHDMTAILQSTLIQIGQFQVFSAEIPGEGFPEERILQTLAEDKGFDNILTGRIRQGNNGRIYQLELFLYSRADNKITLSKSWDVVKMLDFLTVADTAIVDFLSEFTGIPLVFETVVINATGVTGHYNVYLDGLFLGRDLKEIKVLAGPHKLQIAQVSETEILVFGLDPELKDRTMIGFSLKDDVFILEAGTGKAVRITDRKNKEWGKLITGKEPDFSYKITIDGHMYPGPVLTTGKYIIRASGTSTRSGGGANELTCDPLAFWEPGRRNPIIGPFLLINDLSVDWGKTIEMNSVYFEMLEITGSYRLDFHSKEPTEFGSFKKPLTIDIFRL